MLGTTVLDAAAPAEKTVNRDARSRIKSRLFVPDPLPPLKAETYGSFEPAPGVVAERGATLIWNGANDDVVAVPGMGPHFFEDLRSHTIALLGGAKNIFEFGFTPEGGHRPYFVTRPVALWLQEHLHFPNWTEQKIGQMPQTHILDWAA